MPTPFKARALTQVGIGSQKTAPNFFSPARAVSAPAAVLAAATAPAAIAPISMKALEEGILIKKELITAPHFGGQQIKPLPGKTLQLEILVSGMTRKHKPLPSDAIEGVALDIKKPEEKALLLALSNFYKLEGQLVYERRYLVADLEYRDFLVLDKQKLAIPVRVGKLIVISYSQCDDQKEAPINTMLRRGA